MTSPPTKTRESTLLWVRVATLLVALTAITIIASRLRAEQSTAHLFAVLAVQPLNLLALLFAGLRLTVLSGGAAPVWPAIKASSLSSTLLYLLPSRLSELVKPIYLSTQGHLSLLRGIAIVAMERFLDVAIVALLGLAGMLLLSHDGAAPATVWWVALAAVCAAGCILLVWKPALIHAVIDLVPIARLRAGLTRLLDDLIATMSPWRLLLGLLFGLCAWACSFAMIYVLLRLSASVPLDLSAAFLVFLAGTIGIAVAVAPGGVGTFEAGMILALRYHGIDAGEAIALALLSRLANLGFVPLIAVWAAAADGIGVARLVEAARNLRQTQSEG